MTSDVAAVIITAITLPYADKWIGKVFTDRTAKRAHERAMGVHELAKAKAESGAAT